MFKGPVEISGICYLLCLFFEGYLELGIDYQTRQKITLQFLISFTSTVRHINGKKYVKTCEHNNSFMNTVVLKHSTDIM